MILSEITDKYFPKKNARKFLYQITDTKNSASTEECVQS